MARTYKVATPTFAEGVIPDYPVDLAKDVIATHNKNIKEQEDYLSDIHRTLYDQVASGLPGDKERLEAKNKATLGQVDYYTKQLAENPLAYKKIKGELNKLGRGVVKDTSKSGFYTQLAENKQKYDADIEAINKNPNLTDNQKVAAKEMIDYQYKKQAETGDYGYRSDSSEYMAPFDIKAAATFVAKAPRDDLEKGTKIGTTLPKDQMMNIIEAALTQGNFEKNTRNDLKFQGWGMGLREEELEDYIQENIPIVKEQTINRIIDFADRYDMQTKTAKGTGSSKSTKVDYGMYTDLLTSGQKQGVDQAFSTIKDGLGDALTDDELIIDTANGGKVSIDFSSPNQFLYSLVGSGISLWRLGKSLRSMFPLEDQKKSFDETWKMVANAARDVGKSTPITKEVEKDNVMALVKKGILEKSTDLSITMQDENGVPSNVEGLNDWASLKGEEGVSVTYGGKRYRMRIPSSQVAEVLRFNNLALENLQYQVQVEVQLFPEGEGPKQTVVEVLQGGNKTKTDDDLSVGKTLTIKVPKEYIIENEKK